jgi:hypothetical protein
MSYPHPQNSPSSDSNPSDHFSLSQLSVWARAGIVIAGILVAIFIFSTTMVCIVRKGRLFKRERSNLFATSSLPNREYREAEKGLVSRSAEVEIEEEEASGYESGRRSGVGVSFGATVRRPDEVALQDYGHGKMVRDGRRGGQGREEVGWRKGRDGEVYDHLEEQRQGKEETEYRPWHAV